MPCTRFPRAAEGRHPGLLEGETASMQRCSEREMAFIATARGVPHEELLTGSADPFVGSSLPDLLIFPLGSFRGSSAIR